MVRQDDMYDVTIVGGGPVGLYATYYAGLRDCKTKLVDMEPQLGRDLIAELTRQAMQYRPTVVLDGRVVGMRLHGERVIELSTTQGSHFTQAAILAVGCGAFVPRKLDIPHLAELEGQGVYVGSGIGAVNSAKEYINAGALGR